MTAQDFLNVLSSIFVFVVLGLYYTEYRHRQRVEKRLEELEKVTPAKAIKEGQGLLHRAIQKAQVILGAAELEGVKIAATSKFETRELEKKLEEKLGAAIDLQVHEALVKFGDKLNHSAETELAQMHLEVANYKAKKTAAIDQKAVEIMEAVIPQVLGKNLKISDQMELINKAIEQVKAENFF